MDTVCLYLAVITFLIYDAPIRRELKPMPSWRSLRKEVAKAFLKDPSK